MNHYELIDKQQMEDCKINDDINDMRWSVKREFKTGIAQEHAYRPALKMLIEASKTNVIAVNDPSHSEGGTPDFIVTKGILPIAFFEAKDIGKNLEK